MSTNSTLSGDSARRFANEWIASWNSHDLDRILWHYAENVELTSPAAARLLNNPSGTVRGKLALREYFRKGLEALPQLNFELIEVMTGVSSVVIVFRNQRGTKTAEFMELDSLGKVARVVANYSE